MTETVAIDRVSASALALHLDCSRTYVGKLEAEGVIPRQGDGYPLHGSGVATCDSGSAETLTSVCPSASTASPHQANALAGARHFRVRCSGNT
jgi:hypothetical protein